MSLFHKQNEQKKTEYLDDPDEGPIIHLENIVKKFYIGTENELEVLHGISLDAPKKVIGTNTIDCMQSGVINGNAACLDGMIERIEEELGDSAVYPGIAALTISWEKMWQD